MSKGWQITLHLQSNKMALLISKIFACWSSKWICLNCWRKILQKIIKCDEKRDTKIWILKQRSELKKKLKVMIDKRDSKPICNTCYKKIWDDWFE